MRPLIEPKVEVSDTEKSTRVQLAAPQEDEERSGAHIEAVPVIGRKGPALRGGTAELCNGLLFALYGGGNNQ